MFHKEMKRFFDEAYEQKPNDSKKRSRNRDVASRRKNQNVSMPQVHFQHGLFHVVTNADGRTRWCTKKGIPPLILKCLRLSCDLHGASLYAFCVLPDHVHLMIAPGKKGLSRFMQTFKSNSTKEIRNTLGIRVRWQNGFYDEKIRDERQRSAAFGYIIGNGAKHRLVREMEDWPWSSIHWRSICDPLDIW